MQMLNFRLYFILFLLATGSCQSSDFKEPPPTEHVETRKCSLTSLSKRLSHYLPYVPGYDWLKNTQEEIDVFTRNLDKPALLLKLVISRTRFLYDNVWQYADSFFPSAIYPRAKAWIVQAPYEVNAKDYDHALGLEISQALYGLSSEKCSDARARISRKTKEVFYNLYREKGNRIPHRTHRVWITDPETPHEASPQRLQLYIESLGKLKGRDWEHHFWCIDRLRIPKTVEILEKSGFSIQIHEMNEIFASMQGKHIFDAYVQNKQFCFASDIARQNIVYSYGGIYADLGTTFLEDLTPYADAYDYMFTASPEGYIDQCFFGFQKGSPIIKEYLNVLDTLYLLPSAIKDITKTTRQKQAWHNPPFLMACIDKFSTAEDRFLLVPEGRSSLMRIHHAGSWIRVGVGGNKSIFESKLDICAVTSTSDQDAVKKEVVSRDSKEASPLLGVNTSLALELSVPLGPRSSSLLPVRAPYSSLELGVLSPASTPFVEVTRTPFSLARIDLTLTPIVDGNRLKTIYSFLEKMSANPDFIRGLTLSIGQIAEYFSLHTQGYRVIADSTDEGVFHFRLLGGEPLGRTFPPSIPSHDGEAPLLEIYPTQPYQKKAAGPFPKRVEEGLQLQEGLTTHSVSFENISPKVATHQLVIPIGEYVSLHDFSLKASPAEITDFWANAYMTIQKENLLGKKIRLVTNAGSEAYQTIPHFHLHVGIDDRFGVLASPRHPYRLFKTPNISDIVSFVDENTLVLLDLDETLVLDPRHGYNRTITITHLKPVEGDKTVQALKNIQARTPTVLGLTARPYKGEKDVTVETLESLNLGLPNPFPHVKNNTILDDPKSGFWNGIIFTHFRPKGEFLGPFLEDLKTTIGYSPSNILFVDDLERNCLSVRDCLSSLKIPGVVFHYTGAYSVETPQ